ncbi:hypothetical protein SK128_028408 [Halocaridina rubra]|uniref:Reverse transcriptase domain-containing protein n=1 Tax=Halocaridina rubra TaxID=373956 RepID=A0AAN8XCS4_HALRR
MTPKYPTALSGNKYCTITSFLPELYNPSGILKVVETGEYVDDLECSWRLVNERVHGRGLRMVDWDDNEWELNQLLFADDTVVVADSEEKLCQLVSEFGMFGHVKRMDDERLLEKVMNARVDGKNARWRPRFGWIDEVRRALNARRMDVREGSERARNRNEWRAIVTQL